MNDMTTNRLLTELSSDVEGMVLILLLLLPLFTGVSDALGAMRKKRKTMRGSRMPNPQQQLHDKMTHERRVIQFISSAYWKAENRPHALHTYHFLRGPFKKHAKPKATAAMPTDIKKMSKPQPIPSCSITADLTILF